MRDHNEAFVAFDTSKMRNAVAIAEAGRDGEVRFVGEIENTPTATAKLVKKLAGKYQRLTFCYEAGPTGYGLYRQINSLGHECLVAAPSLILKKPGERVKTNRRDAVSLVKQLRSGELAAVWVPATLVMVTLALETLPPDVSKILPDNVAVIACPFAAGTEVQISASKNARETARHTQDGLIRFIALTPKRAETAECRGVYQSGSAADVRT